MREIIFFIASIAGAAVLTALAIVLAPTSPIWKWVLWGGAAVFLGCAGVLAVDYFKPENQSLLKSFLGLSVTLSFLLAFAVLTKDDIPKEQDTPWVYASAHMDDHGKIDTFTAMVGARGKARQKNVTMWFTAKTTGKPMTEPGPMFFPFLDPGSFSTSAQFELGGYFILMRSDAGQFEENLQIELVNGQPKQTIRIVDNNDNEVLNMTTP
jgi:hypothetical protein